MTEKLPCSVCPLHCDLEEIQSQCSLRKSSIDRLASTVHSSTITYQVHGKPSSLDEALSTARRYLDQSKFPLITGNILDSDGSRATVRFSEAIQAAVDLHDSEAAFAMVRSMQTTGMMQTTFSEVRARADVLIIAGDDRLLDKYPMLPSCIEGNVRKIILLGAWSSASRQAFESTGVEVTSMKAQLDDLPSSLRSFFSAHLLSPEDAFGIKDASHLVILWANDCLQGVRSIDLWLQRLQTFLLEANARQLESSSQRVFALPLSGTIATFMQACTWLTGFPSRARYRSGQWEYEPDFYSAARLTEESRCDLRIWIDQSLTPTTIPSFHGPTIVLTTAPQVSSHVAECVKHLDSKSKGLDGFRCDEGPVVFIPISFPGMNAPAYFQRADQGGLVRCGLTLGDEKQSNPIPFSLEQILGRLTASQG